MYREEVEVQLYSFLNFGSRGGGRSTPLLRHFTPGKVTRYLFYRRLSWLQGRSGRVWKNLSHAGIRKLDRP